MRTPFLFLLALLIAGLSSCKKEELPAPDLLLGHWESEQSFWDLRTIAGQPYARYDFRPSPLVLDVTPTTFTFTRDGTVVQQYAYSRTGEALTTPDRPDFQQQFVRALTATSFTLNSTSSVGTYYALFVGRDFHR